jgi:hypothetical protein
MNAMVLARQALLSGLIVGALASHAVAADDPLARARLLYNQRQYQAAVNAADQARLMPAHADAANLIAARAYLERYRESAMSDDLTNARDRLRSLNPQRFGPRERTEYVVGLGEALFFDGAFGAAAHLFDSMLQSRDLIAVDARDRMLDWWATAVDRHVRGLAPEKRAEAFDHLVARMESELRKDPTSAAAAYWVAAASFARGNVDRAWEAAVAGWVRGILSVDRGMTLRPDLDRLVRDAIIPERLRRIQSTASNGEAQATEASMLAEWALIKDQWARP